MIRDLTAEERQVIELLGECASLAGALPELHRSDINEFVGAIHVCQNIIYARPAFETEKARWADE